jgi:hypothetical protein
MMSFLTLASLCTNAPASIPDVVSLPASAFSSYDSNQVDAGALTSCNASPLEDTHGNILAWNSFNTLESMRLVIKNAIRQKPTIESALRLQASDLGPAHTGAQSSLQVSHKKTDQLKVRSSCITCIDRRNPCDGLRPQCWGCLIYGRVRGGYVSHAFEATTERALRPVSAGGSILNATINQYPCVDLASLAGNVVLSWTTSYNCWKLVTEEVESGKLTQSNYNDSNVTLRRMKMFEMVLLGDIYGKLLNITRRIHSGLPLDGGITQGADELRALILLTELISDIGLNAGFIDEDTFPAFGKSHVHLLSLLGRRAQQQLAHAAKFDPVEDVMSWWASCTGLDQRLRLRWTKTTSNSRHFDSPPGFWSVFLRYLRNQDFVSVITPELDQAFDSLEEAFGTGPWTRRDRVLAAGTQAMRRTTFGCGLTTLHDITPGHAQVASADYQFPLPYGDMPRQCL